MSIFTSVTKAYWRESPDQRDCTTCKRSGLPTWQTGHKPRRSKNIDWWGDLRWCQDCKDKLPHTPPPL